MIVGTTGLEGRTTAAAAWSAAAARVTIGVRTRSIVMDGARPRREHPAVSIATGATRPRRHDGT